MIELNKILIPTDFSDGARSAYPVAQEIAKTGGGKIDLIHVIPTLKYFNESLKRLGVPLDMNQDVYPKVIEEAEDKIKKAIGEYFDADLVGDIIVRVDRRPSDVISTYAHENKYDMIIMGSRGKDESKLIRGGVTERVIRKSRIPVFSVDPLFKDEEIKNIVIPTDSSELSIAAFPLAVSIADMYDAELTLLHVIELYGNASEEIPIQPAKGESLSIYEAIIHRVNSYLSKQKIDNIYVQRSGIIYEDEVIITEGENSRTIPLSTKIEKGVSAHYEIENYVEDSADLVVMATHGHSGLAHLILGSTAEKVAQYSKKPVITIRPDEEDFTLKK